MKTGSVRYLNPLGDDTGVLLAFGLCAIVVLVLALSWRTRHHAVLISTLGGLFCGAAVYLLIALVYLLLHGTQGYPFASWLIFVVAGAIPAAAIGLIEGLVASLVTRLFVAISGETSS